MTGELKGFESDPEQKSSEPLRADQMTSIFSLARLVRTTNDGVDPRNSEYFWLDRLLIDLNGANEGRIRILSDPEKSDETGTNWMPTSLLASGQLIMYEQGESIVQGYAGIRQDLSTTGADMLIDYMQSRLEIMGAEVQEPDISAEIGTLALTETVAS